MRIPLSSEDIVFVGILNGAALFLSDVVREVGLECEVDFLRVSSYQGTESTGELKLSLGAKRSFKGKHVIIVEDILDTGLTLTKLVELFREEHPASVEICVFLRKKECLKHPVDPKYVGADIGKDFVIGYGLDFNEKARNLRAVYRRVQE